MSIYLIEWTHDDGMDQHEHVADLTPAEADWIRAELYERQAVDPHVYEPSPTVASCQELVDIIREDLP